MLGILLDCVVAVMSKTRQSLSSCGFCLVRETLVKQSHTHKCKIATVVGIIKEKNIVQ